MRLLSTIPRLAFTLIELMISIAMVVLLLLGINTVFKMSSDTVGTGVAIADLTRMDRSIQAVMQDDFRRAVKDAPLFIIRSGIASANGNWMSLADKNSDRDGNALTYSSDAVSTNEGYLGITGLRTPYSIYNDRNHRVDTLAFPIRGTFHRHTAMDGSYTSTISSSEAWVWYGHLSLPNSSGPNAIGNFFGPGDPNGAGNNTNTNNIYASAWLLGRYETLMKDQNLLPSSEIYYKRNAPDLPPLTPNTLPWSGNQRPLNVVRSSRFDLAGTTLEQLRDDVTNRRLSYSPNLRDGAFQPNGQAIPAASSWWGGFVYMGIAAPSFGGPDVFRYQANSLPGKPATSRAMAQLAPILASGVSQFIVEYAGDFVTQDNNYYITVNGVQQLNPNYGFVLSGQPDGVIDYIVYGTTPNYPRIGTRWYGLPRDVTSRTASAPDTGARDGEILAIPLGNPFNANELVDVVPLNDVLSTIPVPAGSQPIRSVFEREVPIPAGKFYANGATTTGTTAGFYNNFRYTCIWQDSGPTMLRILIKMEDPGGRLPSGQWFEYLLGGI